MARLVSKLVVSLETNTKDVTTFAYMLLLTIQREMLLVEVSIPGLRFECFVLEERGREIVQATLRA